MKCLLIGGDYDGEWMEVNDVCQVVSRPRQFEFTSYIQTPTKHTFEMQTYHRQILADRCERFSVFVFDVPAGGVIKRLLEGYRPTDQGEVDQTKNMGARK